MGENDSAEICAVQADFCASDSQSRRNPSDSTCFLGKTMGNVESDAEKENGRARPILDDRIGRFADRLRMAIGKRSVREFARAAGMSDGAVRDYLRGSSYPSLDRIHFLAKAAGVDISWLATGEGSPDADGGACVAQPGKLTTPGRGQVGLEDEYALIPLYDVRAAAGHGAVVENEQVIDYLAFRRDWLWRELRAGAHDLYLIEVDGDSMEPTLWPGDVILIDRRDAQAVPRDGIYVLRMDSGLLVKRLQRLPGRKIKVTSDNPSYEPFDLPLDDQGDDLAIIGRVVWTGRRM